MATSGTSTFNLELDDLMTEAYERCGIQNRTGYDLRTAQRSLNLLFAEWASRGLNLWTIEQRSLVLVSGVPQYDLPNDTVNVLSAVRRTNSGQSQFDLTMTRVSQNEYLHFPNKLVPGAPVQFFVQRTTTPVLFVYPCPDASQQYTFRYYAMRRIQDAGAYTNTPDVVFRFLPCLVSGLAYYLSVKKAPDRMPMLKQLYEEDFARAAMEDRDTASVFLTPDFGV